MLVRSRRGAGIAWRGTAVRLATSTNPVLAESVIFRAPTPPRSTSPDVLNGGLEGKVGVEALMQLVAKEEEISVEEEQKGEIPAQVSACPNPLLDVF